MVSPGNGKVFKECFLSVFVLLSMVLKGLTDTNGSAVIAQDWTDTVQPSFDGDIFKAPSPRNIVFGVSVLIPGAL